MDAMSAAEQQIVAAETNGSTPIPDPDYEDEAVTQYPASEFSDEEYEADEGINKRRKKEGRNLDRQKNMALAQKKDQPNTQTYSRGLLKPSNHSSKTLQLRLTFGSGDQDILPIIHTRDNWSGGLDLTFPSRESLQVCIGWNSRGSKDIFGVDRETNIRESTTGWDWFYSDIGARFRGKQQTLPITEDVANTHLPSKEIPKTTVLIGPSDAQTTFLLGRGESFDFSSAWPSTESIAIKQESEEAPVSQANERASDAPNRVKAREGWIINLGSKIQCLSWAHNCNGNSQFLAIVAPIHDSQKAQFDDGNIRGAPAFTPSPPYPAAIQIWRFEARDPKSGLRKLNMNKPPFLHMVICTEFGTISRLCWCPISVNRDSDDGNDSKTTRPRPALLAGLWSDGTVKVFNVDLSDSKSETKYAIGSANGFIGVWSLVQSARRESITNPEPYLYVPIHDTYILNVASAYPTHPYIIAATSVGGQTRLVSLQDPAAEVVDALRLRIGTQCLVYSPFLRSFITNDEGDFVRLLPLRRFFSSLAALKSRSIATSLATASLHHPCILAGNAGGAVIGNNPLRKLIHSKEKQWQQTWFSQEWINGGNNNITPGPVVKFYDGFKAETASLAKGSSAQDKEIGQVGMMTVYEEQTAITAIAWNPNASCSGWACAGMGSGLLRVEDLAHE
ncbi:transcription factor TFIIIC complex subunit Tfc6, putative [Trichophyton verrucosum HKI 0517]|uniref:Transcription factor TFIIIC complex subunit Tfc6, putative n=1 Tax=Trichophyton verrucosum (strain HKI 0517) TaxID=663202 RepID=D4DBS0_TRIVH|nr:transcription factor TFIIIC complex subunit Tfc6, putative [Trichophyton verrucosum HKI 0517]EFE40706.1 transcription factor TFIIIC complex subunit Tfc6, putative [Trichophyton verrucosum HKI 0517]